MKEVESDRKSEEVREGQTVQEEEWDRKREDEVPNSLGGGEVQET